MRNMKNFGCFNANRRQDESDGWEPMNGIMKKENLIMRKTSSLPYWMGKMGDTWLQ